MSIIATISVHKCDGCDTIAVLQTDEDVDSFAANWFAGETKDYCPFCRYRLQYQGLIASEEELLKEGSAVKRCSSCQRSQHVA